MDPVGELRLLHRLVEEGSVSRTDAQRLIKLRVRLKWMNDPASIRDLLLRHQLADEALLDETARRLEGEVMDVQATAEALIVEDEPLLEEKLQDLRRYEIGEAIGGGSTTRIFEALDRETGDRVALKVFALGASEDREAAWRFWEEILCCEAVDSPHVACLRDHGNIEGHFYYTMDLVTGVPIDHWVEEHRPSLHEVVRLVARVCRGVAALHDEEILHRDLSPDNVLVDEDGRPVVIDLGVAKRMVGRSRIDMTRRGVVLGSPRYLSPEQLGATADPVTKSSDVYSLAVLLYELTTGGHHPYPEGEALDRAEDSRERDVLLFTETVRREKPRSPRKVRAGYPKALARILRKALEADPTERHIDAASLATELEGWAGPGASETLAQPLPRTKTERLKLKETGEGTGEVEKPRARRTTGGTARLKRPTGSSSKPEIDDEPTDRKGGRARRSTGGTARLKRTTGGSARRAAEADEPPARPRRSTGGTARLKRTTGGTARDEGVGRGGGRSLRSTDGGAARSHRKVEEAAAGPGGLLIPIGIVLAVVAGCVLGYVIVVANRSEVVEVPPGPRGSGAPENDGGPPSGPDAAVDALLADVRAGRVEEALARLPELPPDVGDDLRPGFELWLEAGRLGYATDPAPLVDVVARRIEAGPSGGRRALLEALAVAFLPAALDGARPTDAAPDLERRFRSADLALRLSDDAIIAREARGRMRLALGEGDAAAADLEMALGRTPAADAKDRRTRAAVAAVARTQAGDPETALRLLADHGESVDREILAARALALLALSRAAGAQDELARTEARTRHFLQSHAIGRVAHAMGQKEAAAAAFVEAAEAVDADDYYQPQIYFWAARALHEVGRNDEAARWRAVLERWHAGLLWDGRPAIDYLE